MSHSAISCNQVVKQYGKKRALDGINLTIPLNRVVGILGPNGAGKSSLFRLIMGMIQPDSGSVKVLGQQPGWETNGDISYLPDRARWFPDHTLEQAVEWAEALWPEFDRDKAERLAQAMKIEKDVPAGGMSRGQEARLMLTLCMSRNVPLIVLDEPFSGIDVVSRERIIEGLIDHLSEGKQTILISTHEIYETESLFDHVVFLDQGKVNVTGETEHLRRQHGSMESLFKELYR